MFAILGPVRVRSGATEVAITARRELILLGMLLLHANSTVSTAQLVDAIWAGRPPANARNQVQQCVRLLRRRLAEAGIERPVIVTEPGGYRVVLEPPELDLYEFRTLVDQARGLSAAGQRTQARDSYRAALGLWRGPALTGHPQLVE